VYNTPESGVNENTQASIRGGLAPAADGSIDSHVLVPDSATTRPVPSPASVVLGAVGMALIRRLRQKGFLA
jgi:hypothetical protein